MCLLASIICLYRSLPWQAGMLAGEGLGGVLQALLAVAKVDGSRECFSCAHTLHTLRATMADNLDRVVAELFQSDAIGTMVLAEFEE